MFGDNTIRKGTGGAAKFRHHDNTYGFITKKYPNNQDSSFYKIDEYISIFNDEFDKLSSFILEHSDKLFLISKLGSNLANKYYIYDYVIKYRLFHLTLFFNNVQLLYRWS